jgi:hypothetical protein
MWIFNPVKAAIEATKTDDKMSAEERRNYDDALCKLRHQVIKAAILLGQSSLNGMERRVAEIGLEMVLDQFIAPAFLEPSDRFAALRWFNWGVEGVNAVRTAVGSDVLEIRAGFKNPLVANECNGWK